MSEVIEEPSTIEKLVIPDGLPKSGKVWKQKQVYRSSSQNRKGVLSNLATTFEVKQVQREKIKALKGLEREMKEETQRKKDDAKKRREEQQKRRMANELKTAVYQEIKPEKMKGMSKKQLRSIKKTSMNKNGQVELISPWGGGKK